MLNGTFFVYSLLNMKAPFRIILTTGLVAMLAAGCLVDEGELTPPVPEGFCDSIPATYDNGMKDLVDLHCATPSCHVSGFASGDFTSYATMQASGAFNGTPSRVQARVIDENPSAMPQNNPLPDSVKAVFQCWIDAGFPQQ